MKILVPLVVTLICALFLLPKLREHRSLRKENETLEGAIHRHRERLSGVGQTGGRHSEGKSSVRRDGLTTRGRETGGTLMDLGDKELVKFFIDLDKTLPNFQNELAFREFIENADEDELVAFIGRLAALGLSNDIRDRMLERPLAKLGELNPEAALNLIFELPNYDHDGYRRGTTMAFSNWLKSDAAKAMAWLDGMESRGQLDAKTLRQSSDIRLGFEQVILATYLKDDYEKTRARLMSLPQELRTDVLLFDYSDAQFGELLRNGGLGNLGQLIRELTPVSDHAKNLSSLATMLTWMPLDTGESFEKLVGGMNASREESAEMAKALASQIMFSRTVSSSPPDANAFPSSRELLSQYAPNEEGQVVGKALSAIATTNGFMSTDDTLELLARQFDQFPDDEMVTAFLSRSGPWVENLSGAQRETLSGVVDQMQDATLRTRWQEQIKLPEEAP